MRSEEVANHKDQHLWPTAFTSIHHCRPSTPLYFPDECIESTRKRDYSYLMRVNRQYEEKQTLETCRKMERNNMFIIPFSSAINIDTSWSEKSLLSILLPTYLVNNERQEESWSLPQSPSLYTPSIMATLEDSRFPAFVASCLFDFGYIVEVCSLKFREFGFIPQTNLVQTLVYMAKEMCTLYSKYKNKEWWNSFSTQGRFVIDLMPVINKSPKYVKEKQGLLASHMKPEEEYPAVRDYVPTGGGCNCTKCFSQRSKKELIPLLFEVGVLPSLSSIEYDTLLQNLEHFPPRYRNGIELKKYSLEEIQRIVSFDDYSDTSTYTTLDEVYFHIKKMKLISTEEEESQSSEDEDFDTNSGKLCSRLAMEEYFLLKIAQSLAGKPIDPVKIPAISPVKTAIVEEIKEAFSRLELSSEDKTEENKSTTNSDKMCSSLLKNLIAKSVAFKPMVEYQSLYSKPSTKIGIKVDVKRMDSSSYRDTVYIPSTAKIPVKEEKSCIDYISVGELSRPTLEEYESIKDPKLDSSVDEIIAGYLH
jgi:hypothetical protein